MPAGHVHDKITLVGAVVAAPLWWFLTPPPQQPSVGVTLCTAILFSGWLLSPDLDLNSSIYRRWGPFRFLWWPYQKLVPHRSWVSHSWLLSPILRVAYLLGMCWLMAYAILWALAQTTGLGPGTPTRTPVDLVSELYRHSPSHCAMGMLGLVIGTALHSGADTLWSALKKRR